MNQMDLLTRFRAEVPLRVSPQAEELFRAGTGDRGTERVTTRSRRPPFVILGLDLRWRLVIAAGLAGGVTGILLDARTCGFAGYGKDGAQTLLLRQADVSGPGVRP